MCVIKERNPKPKTKSQKPNPKKKKTKKKEKGNTANNQPNKQLTTAMIP